MVRQHDGPAMPREPLSGSNLVVPAEAPFRIRRELDVVGRVSVDEVARLERDLLEVRAQERPFPECSPIRRKVADIFDLSVAAERNVEPSAPIEATQAVVPGAIEVVEERGGFRSLVLLVGAEFVETIARTLVNAENSAAVP